jgi:WD40 repeat protein
MPDGLNASGEEGHNDCVWKAVFTLEGKELVSCSRDGTLIMWRVEDGKRIRAFRGHKGEICKSVTCCAFNPGATQLNGTVDIARGSMMVSASWDKTLLLWDVETGNVLGELVGHSHYVYCCHFSYDGYLVLSCSHDGTAKLWDVLEATCLKTFNGISEDEDDLPGHDKMVCWCCWRPAQPKLDQQFLTCSADRTLRLWSVKSGKVLLIFEGHEAPVQSCGMTADGKLAISVSWDRTIRIWEANTAQCVKAVPQGAGVEYGISVLGTNDKTVTRIATTGDHLCKLWQLKAERK